MLSASSASLYRRPENVAVEAIIIIAELKLCNVERQIFLADPVVAPDDSTLDDRPEAFNRIGYEWRAGSSPAARTIQFSDELTILG